MWVLYKIYYSDSENKNMIKKEFINSFSSKEELDIVLKLLNKNNTNPSIGFSIKYVHPFSSSK